MTGAIETRAGPGNGSHGCAPSGDAVCVSWDAGSPPVWSRSALRTLLAQSRAEPGARFVLLAIALHVDDGGVAFPSVGTLSELTGISERQIRRHLRQLEAGGELSTEGSEGRFCN